MFRWVAVVLGLAAGALAQQPRIVNSGPGNQKPFLRDAGDLENLQVYEDTPVGTVVHTLEGQDPEGSRLLYTISSDFFSVDSDSGAVSLIKPLDRELRDTVDVVITIQDEPTPRSGTDPHLIAYRGRFTVLDRNDNKPVFSAPSYTFTVAETEPAGRTVFTGVSLTDKDAGQNSQVRLRCTEESSPDACDTFEIFADGAAGVYRGLVTLKKALNYEERSSYNIIIEAIDAGTDRVLSSTASIFVQVEDVQDQDPVFLNAPYSDTVPEGTPEGSQIFEIQVRDGDTGIPRPIELTLEGDRLSYFELQPPRLAEDGVMRAALTTTGNIIDREHPDILKEGGLYTFKIRARELIDNSARLYGEETTTSVTIVVTDIDDEQPVFNRNSFTVPVPEDVGTDTPLPGLTLEVVDKDVSRNAEFTLTLESLTPNTEGVFSVYPERAIGKTPVIIRVKNPDRLDYENEEMRNFEFNVVAETNNGVQIKSNVKVIVTDSNDNVPRFEKQGYEFSVAEDAKAGEIIDTIVAIDTDSGNYGEVLYSIKGFGSEKFYVQAETGDIMVAACGRSLEEGGTSCLDWETEKSFSLTYKATDGGGQTTTTNLLLKIEDKNDNHPKFDREEYRRVVREGDTTFHPELIIRATDRDGPIQGGGKVFYEINSINTDATVFDIDPMSGQITMIKPVRMEDTENGRYDLVVRAIDTGKPPLHSDVKVYVNMGSIRNQKPKFVQPRYDIAIRENAELGSEVLQVGANDPDGKNSGLTYFIHSGSKDNFKIGPKTGIIRVAPDAILDIEQNGEEYRMEVRVVDGGSPHQQTSQTMVTVTVQDVNNKPPVFDQKLYTAYVLENESQGYQVLTVTATDQDRNADLEYDIIEPIIARDKSGTELENIAAFNFKSVFTIDPSNGKISINEKLSYSSAAVIILSLEVRDKNAEEDPDKQVATAEATLYIQAFNADNPVFPPPWTPSDPTIHVNISENRPPGESFFNLGAKDPLTGEEVVSYLKLNSDDTMSDIIQISPYGDVISNRLLDYEKIKSISFSVAAVVGTEGDERSSDAHITLHLVDVNDNAPLFDQPEYSVEVREDALPLTTIVTVHASDSDTGEFGMVTYSLEGEGSREFMIDALSGQIQIKPGPLGRSGLDREWKPTYNLRVLAKDMPGGGSDQKASSVLVKVILGDVNDSPPNFSEASYRAVVPENSAIGTLVGQISATDPDLNINSNNLVQYDFANPSQIKGLYRINRATGEIFTNSILTGKGRREPYVISVRALDSGTPQQFRDTDLYVTVGDVSRNDGVPKFMKPEPGQVANVPEESSIGTAVFQAEAVDPDDPNTANGKLVYSFPDDGTIVRKLFQIDSNTGLITTRVSLDREEREEYTLILEARDLGNPVQETTRLLTVKVRDVDDHPPHFIRQRNSVPLSMQLEEELPLGTKIGEVMAVDEDTGKNAIINYAIIYGNDDDIFAINRDEENRGIISLNKRLDREKSGLHTLTIKCFPPSSAGVRNLKRPYDKLAMDEVQVKVHVQDKDDNNPTFVEQNITLGVRVNAAIYTELGTIHAEDRDAEAKPVVYSLDNVTFHRPKTQLHRQLGVSGFLVDPSTGVLQTNQSYGKYADGYFQVKVKASNSPDPTKADFTNIKIFVLQDTDLMKFVFDKNPVLVAEEMKQFKADIEEAFAQPLTLNIYDSEFYSQYDGSLDFGRTSSCFQVLKDEDTVNLNEVMDIFDEENPQYQKLKPLLEKYSVDSVERCARVRAPPKINWIQTCILVIGIFIGLASFIATITLCCLYSKYKRRIRRSNIKIVEAPVRALIPASLPPGSIMGMGPPAPSLMGAQAYQQGGPSVTGSNGRIYEWQETAMPIDTQSYRSLPR